MRLLLTCVLGLAVTAAGACGDGAPVGKDGDAGDGGDGGDVKPFDAQPADDATSPVDAGADADADAALDGGSDADASLLSPTFVHRDINHVLATGQSLSVGSRGNPPLTLVQPYDNITFVTGVMSGGTGLTSFVPLVEGDLLGATPVETMSSSFANLVTKMARDTILVGQPPGKTSHDLLVSAHGVGGTAYVGLKKGTTPYANGIAQVTKGLELATGDMKSYVVRAVTNVHGESDHNANNAAYEADLIEWQSDYESDVKAITGQAEPIPMFETQFSSWTRLAGQRTTSDIPAAQLAAHVNAPGKVILVGAKYHLPYATDGVHLTNEGYRHMGEDYAKAYRRVVLEGKTWEPVRPKTITRAGAVVTVKMHVPAPPLVLDTVLVTDPGMYGFEWTDDDGTTTIASVALAGADTVTVTLSAAPGANGRLRYAYTGVAGALGGPTTGARGNLRDSDATVSRDGYALYNWCVHFDAPVP